MLLKDRGRFYVLTKLKDRGRFCVLKKFKGALHFGVLFFAVSFPFYRVKGEAIVEGLAVEHKDLNFKSNLAFQLKNA